MKNWKKNVDEKGRRAQMDENSRRKTWKEHEVRRIRMNLDRCETK